METKLLSASQSFGLELPFRILAYDDKNGQTVIEYYNPKYLALKHDLSEMEVVIDQITRFVEKVTDSAARINPNDYEEYVRPLTDSKF